MSITPTESKFDRIESGKPYRAVFKAAQPVPGAWKQQLRVTFDVTVDGEIVEVSDWLNLTVNAAKGGTPSRLLSFLNACAGKESGARVTYFDETTPPYTWSYREDKQPEFALTGSEVLIRGQHQQRKDNSGTFFSIVTYDSVPPAKPATAKPKPTDEPPPPGDEDAATEDDVIPFET